MKKQWEDERRQLLGEKAVLQNAAHKLNQQVRDAQAEVRRIAQTEKAGQRARASVEGVGRNLVQMLRYLYVVLGVGKCERCCRWP